MKQLIVIKASNITENKFYASFYAFISPYLIRLGVCLVWIPLNFSRLTVHDEYSSTISFPALLTKGREFCITFIYTFYIIKIIFVPFIRRIFIASFPEIIDKFS